MVKLNDNQYKDLSDKSYSVDEKAHGKKAVGKTFILSKGYKYKVVCKYDDKSNGFQGLAVAPIVHGKVDYNNVQIAIAGTNAQDNHDLITDASEIKEARDVADKDPITKKVISDYGDYSYQNGSSQFNSADRFYNSVQYELLAQGKKDGKNYTIKHGTGHSLGGALMIYLAAEHHFPITTFSSADPRDRLNSKQLTFINNHPEMFRDYYHKGDWISDWQDTAHLGKAFVVSEFESKTAAQNLTKYINLNGHYLDSYHFDKTGQVITNPVKKFALELQGINAYYRELKNSGSFTDAEKIMLDAAAAISLVKEIEADATETLDIIIKQLRLSIRTQESYWQKTTSHINDFAVKLSKSEALASLEKGGANYHTVVGIYKVKYERQLVKANKLKSKFEDWSQKTLAGIEKMVEDDQQLAGIFNYEQ